MNDTDEQTAAIYHRLIMSKSGSERLLMGFSMLATARALAEASIRAEHPEITPTELKVELFRRFYSQEFDEEQQQRIIAHLLTH